MNNKKYKLIYADCPWQFDNRKTGGSMKSSAESQYNTMSLAELKALDIQSITDDNCLLVMWWVSSMPQEALDLCKAWGFTVKNMNGFVWNKLTVKGNPFFGMGFYTRAGSESALIAIKGKPSDLIVNKSIRAVGSYPISTHSTKPDEFRKACVDLVGNVPRLEMFARRMTPGWSVFGNQVPASIEIGVSE